MKGIWPKFQKGEQGQALLAVILFLLVGSVIITATLGLTTTSIQLGETVRQQVKRFYSADAGIEHGLWRIRTADPGLLGHLPDSSDNFTVNGLQVVVAISWNSVSENYTINSTATDTLTGRELNIVKYYVKTS